MAYPGVLLMLRCITIDRWSSEVKHAQLTIGLIVACHHRIRGAPYRYNIRYHYHIVSSYQVQNNTHPKLAKPCTNSQHLAALRSSPVRRYNHLTPRNRCAKCTPPSRIQLTQDFPNLPQRNHTLYPLYPISPPAGRGLSSHAAYRVHALCKRLYKVTALLLMPPQTLYKNTNVNHVPNNLLSSAIYVVAVAVEFSLLACSDDVGATRDFSHSSRRLLAVRLMLLGESRLTTFGRISSSLFGDRMGVSTFFGFLSSWSALCLKCLWTHHFLYSSQEKFGSCGLNLHWCRVLLILGNTLNIIHHSAMYRRSAPTRALHRHRRLPIRPIGIVHGIKPKRRPRKVLIFCRTRFFQCRLLLIADWCGGRCYRRRRP